MFDSPVETRDPSSDAVSFAEHKKLRILMVAARCFPFMGGIETHVNEVARRMASRGHKVRVVTSNPGGRLPAREELGAVELIRVKAYPADRDYYFAPSLYEEVQSGHWDILHVQGYHTLVPPLAMAAAIRKKLPFVITFHSGGHSSDMRNRMRGPQRAILAPLARKAAHLIGVSEYEAELFSRTMKIPHERFTVVPNGAELPQPSTDALAERDPNRPLILTIGRLERYKGHHRVIEAMPAMLKRFPNARLRILGEGPCKAELVELAQTLGVAQSVEIGGIPASSRQAMADLIVKSAVVALISDYEAHPVAVLEALSLGRRVVATDSSGFKEMARDGLIKVVPLDATPEILAQTLVSEIEAPEAVNTVKLPNWEDCTSQLLGIYQNVANRKANYRN